MKKQIIAAMAVVAMVGASSADVLFASDFDAHTGVPTSGYVKDGSGSTTAGVTWDTQDSSVTAISGLSVVTSGSGAGAGFVNQGTTYSTADNLKVNYNLNKGGAEGYSLTFTTDTSWDLKTLTVLAGHTNDTTAQDQAFVSTLHFSLSGTGLGAPVIGASVEDYDVGPYMHTVAFDLTGNTMGAGDYTLQVTSDTLTPGGGAYAVYDGITLEAIPEPATLGLIGMFGGGLFVIRRKFMI